MAKTLIGNIKGKNGRGITSIKKTGTTGSVDTYTIAYTDSTTSTFTINNSDSISLQRQIVPSAAVESSATASQAYVAGAYVVVNGALRKVKSAITKGDAISDSNSTATTVTGELAAVPMYETDNWSVVRVGMTVFVNATEITTEADSWATLKCPYTVPEELRPAKTWQAPMTVGNGGSITRMLRVSKTGVIDVFNYGATGSSNVSNGTLSYPIGM